MIMIGIGFKHSFNGRVSILTMHQRNKVRLFGLQWALHALICHFYKRLRKLSFNTSISSHTKSPWVEFRLDSSKYPFMKSSNA